MLPYIQGMTRSEDAYTSVPHAARVSADLFTAGFGAGFAEDIGILRIHYNIIMFIPDMKILYIFRYGMIGG